MREPEMAALLVSSTSATAFPESTTAATKYSPSLSEDGGVTVRLTLDCWNAGNVRPLDVKTRTGLVMRGERLKSIATVNGPIARLCALTSVTGSVNGVSM